MYGAFFGEIVSVLFSDKLVGWVGGGRSESYSPAACGVELSNISKANAKVNTWSARYEVAIHPDELDDLVDLGMDAWVVNPNTRKGRVHT